MDMSLSSMFESHGSPNTARSLTAQKVASSVWNSQFEPGQGICRSALILLIKKIDTAHQRCVKAPTTSKEITSLVYSALEFAQDLNAKVTAQVEAAEVNERLNETAESAQDPQEVLLEMLKNVLSPIEGKIDALTNRTAQLELASTKARHSQPSEQATILRRPNIPLITLSEHGERQSEPPAESEGFKMVKPRKAKTRAITLPNQTEQPPAMTYSSILVRSTAQASCDEIMDGIKKNVDRSKVTQPRVIRLKEAIKIVATEEDVQKIQKDLEKAPQLKTHVRQKRMPLIEVRDEARTGEEFLEDLLGIIRT